MTESMATTQLKKELKKLVCDVIDDKFETIKIEIDSYKEKIKDDEKEKRDKKVEEIRKKYEERVEKIRDQIALIKKEKNEELEVIKAFICKEYHVTESTLDKKLANEFGFCKQMLKNGKRCTRKLNHEGVERSDQYGYCKTCRPNIYYKAIQDREIKARIGDALTDCVDVTGSSQVDDEKIDTMDSIIGDMFSHLLPNKKI